ncbi:MAG: hypothetical protein JNK87_16455 [Bryobacterales bacterium]|nr:hypothetical protein [Bryobacterales bacterium]
MKLSALLFCAFTLGLNGQTLVQHSIAAAGGSAAGVAGKKVSDGVDKLMGKVSEITDDAADSVKSATTGKKTRSLPQSAGIPKATAVPAPRATASPRHMAARTPRAGAPKGKQNIAATRRVQALDTVDAYLPPSQPAPTPLPAPVPQPTAGDLQSLNTGATRDQLADRMGKPTAKITMAEDGKLVEVYTYRNAGTVRVVDGTVADIRLK